MEVGELVVHGDVGRTFRYGTKGGEFCIRDPEHTTAGEQVNGRHFHAVAEEDCELIKPYLVENEKLFGIRLADLLTHNGNTLSPAEIYRKVGAMKPAEAVKIIADDDANLGMISSVGGKKRTKGAA